MNTQKMTKQKTQPQSDNTITATAKAVRLSQALTSDRCFRCDAGALTGPPYHSAVIPGTS